jgi:digeranylgeranylglycerophospholipid reductase
LSNKPFLMTPNAEQVENTQDVIVVGGGPAGSSAALNLAQRGFGVMVFEEHPTIGEPSHCAGHISIRSLRNLGLYPLPTGIVENTFSAANFYSPMGTKFSVRLAQPVTAAVNRVLFDQYLAEKAQEAGVRYRLNTRVESLRVDGGFVKGVSLTDGGKAYAKVVVDAEGISSRLSKQAGLPALNRHGIVYAVETEMEGVQDVEADAAEVYVGRMFAPGFYAWLIPRRDGTAKVGLATKTGNPKEFLQRLMRKHLVASKQLGKAKITRTAFHTISLGGPISKTYTNGFLAVGDAASQVKPTTGGGVIFGLTCARIAAEVAAEALKRNDVSADVLRLYQQRCDEALGFDVSVMLRARRFLNSLSDEKLDEALRFCARVGLDKTLETVEEIDFQGQAFLKLLTKPSMFAALGYFLFLYLSANP